MSTQPVDQLSPDFVSAYAEWLGIPFGEALELLREEPLEEITDVQAAGWDESKHPRHPPGSEKGGQFAPKATPIGLEGAPQQPGEYETRQVLSEMLVPLPAGSRIKLTAGPNPGTWEKQPDGKWFKVLPDGRLYERPVITQGFWPGIPGVLRKGPAAADVELVGSARDPGWDADPLEPRDAEFTTLLGNQHTYSAIGNSDTAWDGELNPNMHYDLDEAEFVAAVDAQGSLENYKQTLEEEMRRFGEEGELRITTPDGDALTGIVDDGRFKSQFETGTSGGALLPEIRAAQEEMFFGYPQDMPAERRPLYGWLEHPDAPHLQEQIPRQYGTVTWHIKEDVKARTTVTFLDSLSRPVVPGPIRNPGWRATAPPGYSDPGVFPGAISDHLHDTGLVDDVIETQYHGGLSLDDVEAATITVFGGYSVQEIIGINKEAIDSLKARGIPVNYIDEYGDELSEDDFVQ